MRTWCGNRRRARPQPILLAAPSLLCISARTQLPRYLISPQGISPGRMTTWIFLFLLSAGRRNMGRAESEHLFGLRRSQAPCRKLDADCAVSSIIAASRVPSTGDIWQARSRRSLFARTAPATRPCLDKRQINQSGPMQTYRRKPCGCRFRSTRSNARGHQASSVRVGTGRAEAAPARFPAVCLHRPN